MNNELLIKAENVNKKFCRHLKKSLWYGIKDIFREIFFYGEADKSLRPGEFWALQDVSFELRRGECLGLIGRNGAGKSTLLKLLNGLIKPDRGKVYLKGRVGALIELGAGFNPILSGRENIYINAAVLGIKKREIEQKIDDIINFSDIREFIDMPVQSYSSGMKVRLGFSIATAMKPDILLLDEVLAVGDANFRAKCLERIGNLLKDSAVVFVSHNMPHIQRISNRVLLLNNGKTAFLGAPQEGISKYIDISAFQETTLTIKGKDVLFFECHLENEVIQYGGKICLKLNFKTRNRIPAGQCLCNIADQGDMICGQAEFSDILENIPSGKSELNLIIPEVLLSKGKYLMNITIFSKDGKQTLVQARHCASFTMHGPIGFGPRYQMRILQKKLNQ
jgi:lipopolysaccharide transport system ATP-binding protein